MHLNHTGIVNASEDEAMRFYRDFLGFRLTKEYIVPSDLSSQIFEVSSDIKMLVFERDQAKIEVFISPRYTQSTPVVNHFGLLLDDFSEIVEKAQTAGVEVITGRTKDKTVYFLKDYSGNLIEIKQK